MKPDPKSLDTEIESIIFGNVAEAQRHEAARATQQIKSALLQTVEAEWPPQQVNYNKVGNTPEDGFNRGLEAGLECVREILK